jgi:type II secretory pathway component GspD/PulD (secretin)
MKLTLFALLVATLAAGHVSGQTSLPVVGPADQPLNSLGFGNAPVEDIVTFYSRLTDVHVIRDTQLTGRIFLESGQPVTRAKAIELIETALFANGFSIIQTQPDTIQIVGLGKSARSEAIPLLTKPEQLPKAERVSTYLFKLKYRDTAEMTKLLKAQYVPTISELPYILPDAASRSVVVTARSSVLREMVRLVDELDVSMLK